jgi:hypothetical protein
LKNFNAKGLYRHVKNHESIGIEDALVTASAKPRAHIIQARVTITGLIPIFEISKPLRTPILVATKIHNNRESAIFPVKLKMTPARQLDKTIILPDDRSIFPEIITKVIPIATIDKDAFC